MGESLDAHYQELEAARKEFKQLFNQRGMQWILSILLDLVSENLEGSSDEDLTACLTILWRDLSMTLRHYEGRYDGTPDS